MDANAINELIQRFVDPTTHRGGDGLPGSPWPEPPGGQPPDVGAAVASTIDTFPGLHGVVAVQRGHLIVERYGRGPDMSWGKQHGEVTFDAHTLHDIRSITKSVVAILYGIAYAEGHVPDPAEPLLAQFPEYPDLAADPDRAGLTVGHALTMTLGLEWKEELPYDSPENGEIAMMLAPDRWRYTLERPVETAPGQQWAYCGGASELVGRLVAKGTGVPLPEFAWTNLFEPLGIGAFEWLAGADGIASAASGLRLAPRDLARIGQAVLDDGRQNGYQVISTNWLESMLRPHTTTAWGDSYGYQWYIGGDGESRWVGGIGNGQQRLHVYPELDLVIVMTTGNYDNPDWRPVAAVTEPIVAHVSHA